MKPQQKDVVETVLQQFKFSGLNDHKTTITKSEAAEGIDKLEALKPKILIHIPKDYTIRLRHGIYCGADAICVLRQLIRYTKNHRLVSLKKQKWNKKLKRNEVEYYYRII